jgi:hypothetical protein
MFEVPSLDDLKLLIQSCSCDLRQILLTLQFLVQSSNIKNLPKYSFKENNTIISKSQLQSSRIFDAMYYSHLNKQWTESILSIYFDDLTRKYTSKYQQSHLLLINQSKNNAKR